MRGEEMDGRDSERWAQQVKKRTCKAEREQNTEKEKHSEAETWIEEEKHSQRQKDRKTHE